MHAMRWACASCIGWWALATRCLASTPTYVPFPVPRRRALFTARRAIWRALMRQMESAAIRAAWFANIARLQTNDCDLFSK